MSVNGVAFYVFAAVAVLAAVAVVGLPSLRHAAYALAALGVATALLFLTLGNELLFAAELLIYGLAVPAVVLTAATLIRTRASEHDGAYTSWWPIAVLVGMGTGALPLAVAAVSTSAWSPG